MFFSRQAFAAEDGVTQHNLRVESYFSAFNGVFLGLVVFASPVVAVAGFEVSPLELTILVSAFPVGAFLGPLWAYLGRHWGMKRLVTMMAVWANLPLFFIYFLQRNDSVWFTAMITLSLLLNSAMRMGQSSLYRIVYPKELRGRVLGILTFWQYSTMVPTILLTGWLLDKSSSMYQVLYPMAGLCGVIGCCFYGLLHVVAEQPAKRPRSSWRAAVRGVESILASDRAYVYFQFAFFLSGSSFFMSTHIVLLLTRERFGWGAFELALWLTTIPQILLVSFSQLWGRFLDRYGVLKCRLMVSILMTTYLACYFAGILWGLTGFIIFGSILRGISNGAGQITWSLASSYFAPRIEDVPAYNGIHFVLNGVRGLVMPWVGSILLVMAGGAMAIAAAAFTSLASIPLVLRSMQWANSAEEPVLRLITQENSDKSA